MGGAATPAQEVAAGVFAGVADALACHPIDVVKTQFHVNAAANGSVTGALAAQMRAGGLRSLYRGLLPACLRPQALCMYTGNEWAKARHGDARGTHAARSGSLADVSPVRSASWQAAASSPCAPRQWPAS